MSLATLYKNLMLADNGGSKQPAASANQNGYVSVADLNAEHRAAPTTVYSGASNYNDYLLQQAMNAQKTTAPTATVPTAAVPAATAPAATEATTNTETVSAAEEPQQADAPAAPGYDLSEYLRQQAAAKLESDLAALEGAYQTSLAEYNSQLERLPQTYNAARNASAAQDALARQAMDLRANANGLSTGARANYDTAQRGVYQGNLSAIDQQQANAVSDIELEKAKLQQEYQTAIAQARADGDATLANNLYNELVRVQGLGREDAQTAQNIALQYGIQYGDDLGSIASIKSLDDLAGLTYYGSNGRPTYSGSGSRSGSGTGSSSDTGSDGTQAIPDASYVTPDGSDARSLGGKNYNTLLDNVLGGTFSDIGSALAFIWNELASGTITATEAARLEQIARNQLS